MTTIQKWGFGLGFFATLVAGVWMGYGVGSNHGYEKGWYSCEISSLPRL